MTEAPADDLNPPQSAYELLTKPTLEISDAEALCIIKDLRKRRKAYLDGVADNPAAKAKAKAKPTSAAAKKANTAALLAGLDLKLPGGN